MPHHISPRWLFGLFFLSGFSALICQIVWLRLAFAAFGIVTPVMSVLLSAFMLGLGLGSWLAGAIVKRWPWSWQTALRAYAGAEFLIGVGALTVPSLFIWGERLLLPVGETDSYSYLVSSAIIIAAALVPFCVCMGMTFPFMLQAVKMDGGPPSGFSYLYLANVIGAMFGTLAAPFILIELWGFQATLVVAACANWCAAAASLRLSRRSAESDSPSRPLPIAPSTGPREAILKPNWSSGLTLAVLFTTGLTSMAVEVIWTRAFTPVFHTQVYWFSGLLFTYLLATWLGSALYRWQLARGRALPSPVVLALLALGAFGQLLLADPRIRAPGSRVWIQLVWILAGIGPYCAILGYLTPKLIDEYSVGNPTSAGRAYAVNVLGCIIGPLVASYLLLPRIGVHWSGILLALPLLGLAAIALRSRPPSTQANDTNAPPVRGAKLIWGAAAACGLLVATVGMSREDQLAVPGAMILRDHTATVIADVSNNRKRLFVNGTLITLFTPSTKLMAHLPLSHLTEPPRSALVICFGMGTTYRSLLSWDIETTAVELVPSVRDAFGYFFVDADELRRDPHGRIIIDDGRRYLRRTTERFDVITLDPPPPVEAAGSSLLYSTEFYELIKPRLSEHGILQQWFPGGDLQIFHAILRSITKSFPHVRVMRACDRYGYHILASQHPIPVRSGAELAERLPDRARGDIVEWSPNRTPGSLLGAIVDSEFDPIAVIGNDSSVIITDNHPFNEYCLLRRLWQSWTGMYTIVF